MQIHFVLKALSNQSDNLAGIIAKNKKFSHFGFAFLVSNLKLWDNNCKYI